MRLVCYVFINLILNMEYMIYIIYQVIHITYQSFSNSVYDLCIFKYILNKYIICNTSYIGYIFNIYMILCIIKYI